nr:MAG TPA: hypothetical protein [Caudoviricetes sp.]
MGKSVGINPNFGTAVKFAEGRSPRIRLLELALYELRTGKK